MLTPKHQNINTETTSKYQLQNTEAYFLIHSPKPSISKLLLTTTSNKLSPSFPTVSNRWPSCLTKQTLTLQKVNNN